MKRLPGRLVLVLGLVWLVLAPACTCAKKQAEGEGAPATSTPTPAVAVVEAGIASGAPVFSGPIAAARLAGTEDVVVVGLDVSAKALRLRRVGADGATKLDRTVLDDVAWTSDADVRLFASARAMSLVWRGKRAGKAGRTHVVLGEDLAPRGAPADVSAAGCATQDVFLHADGKRVTSIAVGAGARALAPVDVPKDREVALVCGAHRAFMILEHDDGADVGVLATGPGAWDAGALVTRPLLREAELGDDARERAEYVVGDELGVVRLASGGALAWRETKEGRPGKLEKLKTTIPQDDDVVAVDASPRVLVVVHTQEVEGACNGAAGPATKVVALRVDRATGAENAIDLAPPSCGREIGPFYTSTVGDAVNVSWVERVPTAGRARPPIAALAHVSVPHEGAPRPLLRVDLEADALADAGCDASGCVAAALLRQEGMDAMVPGPIRVIRYAP